MSKVSIITLVNDIELYDKCVRKSFGNSPVELISVMYPESAASGLNEGIDLAKNDLIVMCHQDVVFPENWIEKLQQQIALINDSNFGVLGVYGIKYDCSDGIGNVKSGNRKLHRGNPPGLAMSLDECCLIIRKSSGLRFDESLVLFHMYGADICLTAYSKGMNCYAIDAEVCHLSNNLERTQSFLDAVEWFKNKWVGKTKFKEYRTTCCPRFAL